MLPKPDFNLGASPLEIKRYLVTLVEEIERQIEQIKEDNNASGQN